VITPFGKAVANLTNHERLRFYEIFARRLTLSIRLICTAQDDAQKAIKQVKWLNEIMHRVIAKTVGERLGHQDWSDSDFEAMVQDFVNKNPSIEWFVNECIESSFEEVAN
jgi:hypothetical protein